MLAILTIGLGSGAATATFSVFDRVVLRPFPYKSANEIVLFQVRDPSRGPRSWRPFFQVPEFIGYQEQLSSVKEIMADTPEDFFLEWHGVTERINGGLLSGNAFSFLGVDALTGRVLGPGDVEPGAPSAFVISARLWTSKFGRDASVVGKTFVVDGQASTLVGVMPERFRHLDADLWRVVKLSALDAQGQQRFFTMRTRIADDVTLEQAEAEFAVVASRMAPDYPRLYPKDFAVKALPWIESAVSSFKATVVTVVVAVSLLVLIAWGNVASMVLARSTARQVEMGVRKALGAARSQLVMQSVIESGILGAAGAIVGIGVALVALWGSAALLPAQLVPSEAVLSLDSRALAFGLVVSIVGCVVYGAAPGLAASNSHVALKQALGSFQAKRILGVLVVGEVSLSIVMLVSAGLAIQTFSRLKAVELGYQADGVVFVDVRIPSDRLGPQERTGRLEDPSLRRVLEELTSVPFVRSVTMTSSLPPFGGLRALLSVQGRSYEGPATVQLASEMVFDVLQRNVVRGVGFSAQDVATGRSVAVVNEQLARTVFGSQDPIGRTIDVRFQARWDGSPDSVALEVVGVVADAKNRGLQEPSLPEVIAPYSIARASGYHVMARVTSDGTVDKLRDKIVAVEPQFAVMSQGTLSRILMASSFANPRFSVAVLSALGLVALALVTIGIYGTVSYVVSLRTREIGVRMALGATSASVQILVIRTVLLQIAIGSIVGIGGAVVVTRIMASQLWGITAYDPTAAILAVVMITIAGMVGSFLPAFRASRADPSVVLRR